MALSSALLSTFLLPETPRPPFSSSLALPSPTVKLANLRTLSITSCATSSQPSAAKASSRKPRGIMNPRPVSPEMQDLVGMPEISRTQALKRIWDHIKGNNLQDPDNKKIIVCDDKLKKIFGGKDRVGFLEIAGLITPHFIK